MADARAALEGFLAKAAGAARVTISEMVPLRGGAIQENWRIAARAEGGPHAGPLDLVVRTDAPSRVLASHGRAEEFALLKAAHAAGVAVAEPLWLCTDESVLGKDFFVVRRVGGVAAGHRLVKEAAEPGDALAAALGAELARIHAIRPPRCDLGFLALPEPSPALAAVAAYRAYLGRRARKPGGSARPVLEWGLRWLERHAPPAGEIVLCHRDFRTGNYMVENGRLTAILDWEFAAWGDPLEDIGWFCAKCWRFGAVGREAGGIGGREAFYRGYERAAGRAIDRAAVPYWEVMAHLRWAVIALQQAGRHLSGAEPSLELALTAHVVPELELEILKSTGE